jgi:hypothetical protein
MTPQKMPCCDQTGDSLSQRNWRGHHIVIKSAIAIENIGRGRYVVIKSEFSKLEKA